MTTSPETRYAKSGEIHIAYQVVGEGPFDLVLILGWVSHVELLWEAVLFGVSEGGPMAFLFAATYPQGTTALVLYGEYARMAWAPDYPIGIPRDNFERLLQRIDERWGTGAIFKYRAPDAAGDERLRQWWAQFERRAASPGASMALLRMAYEIDAVRSCRLSLSRRSSCTGRETP